MVFPKEKLGFYVLLWMVDRPVDGTDFLVNSSANPRGDSLIRIQSGSKSMADGMVWGHVVAGSNPAFPTK